MINLMVREGQKRKNRGSSPKIDESPQLAVLNNLNGSSPFFRRNEILFYAENQRKFIYLTSEASSIIEFELILSRC